MADAAHLAIEERRWRTLSTSSRGTGPCWHRTAEPAPGPARELADRRRRAEAPARCELPKARLDVDDGARGPMEPGDNLDAEAGLAVHQPGERLPRFLRGKAPVLCRWPRPGRLRGKPCPASCGGEPDMDARVSLSVGLVCRRRRRVWPRPPKPRRRRADSIRTTSHSGVEPHAGRSGPSSAT